MYISSHKIKKPPHENYKVSEYANRQQIVQTAH